jgi:sulfatase maturation enzyme AslB (radical SAM superfamily)
LLAFFKPYVQLEFEWILMTPFCHNKFMAIVTICGDLIFDVAIYIIYMCIDFFFLKSRKKGFCKENPLIQTFQSERFLPMQKVLWGRGGRNKGHKNINEIVSRMGLMSHLIGR